MLNATMCEILSEGDEYDRARQREVFQLQRAVGEYPGYPADGHRRAIERMEDPSQ